MLELKNINTVFNKGTVDELKLFDDFNFKVSKGEFVSVVGSNGSGKTTLLNLICGSLYPDSGSVLFEGKDITKKSEHKRASYIGRVFQDPTLGTCSSLTVLENFALVDNKNKRYSLTPAINKKRIDHYRDLLSRCNMGLEDRLGVKVGALSGGQRQAIALILAGMNDVKLLILDEHTAALDPKSSETIMNITNDFITNDSEMTAIMVTHNMRFAADYGNRIVLMHEGNAVLDESGERKTAITTKELRDKFNDLLDN